jgi:hypothetical protein
MRVWQPYGEHLKNTWRNAGNSPGMVVKTTKGKVAGSVILCAGDACAAMNGPR